MTTSTRQLAADAAAVLADAAPTVEVDAAAPPSPAPGVAGGCSCHVGTPTPAGATTLMVVLFGWAARIRRRLSR